MLAIETRGSGSRAELCLSDPKSERLKAALEPGKAVSVTLEGTVGTMTLRDGHADVSVDLDGVSVRPEGRKTISGLIVAKQKEAVR